MYEIIDANNKDSIECIRQKFLTEAETKPNIFHRIDIERVRTEGWQIERFILDTSTVDEAFRSLVRAMEWKNSFGLHEKNDKYFPKELFQIFSNEKYSRDKEGRLVAWVQYKDFRKVPEMTLLFKQFLAHQIERLDRRSGNKGWVLVSDCLGTGMVNVDMTLSKFRVELLNYFPKGLKLGINVDLPWILGPFFNLIKNFLNHNIRDHVILITRKQLLDYIDVQSVPISFGGEREASLEVINGLLPLRELKHLDLTDKQIHNFYDIYKFKQFYD